MVLTTNKLFRADGQDVTTKKAGRVSTDSRDRLLKLAVGQPRPQPLHMAVTQQAACVQDKHFELHMGQRLGVYRHDAILAEVQVLQLLQALERFLSD